MKLTQLFEVNKPEQLKETDDTYTKKLQVPHYQPSTVKPKMYELIDKNRYIELLRNINTSNVDDETKEFLKLAATRHLVFNYSKIADYYAHASKEVQELMEQSALVIVDIDNAIANGYVRLSETIQNIMEESGVVH